MINENVTFNDLPELVVQVLGEVAAIKEMVGETRKDVDQLLSEKPNRHRPMSVKQASEYLQMPLGTLYEKLRLGEIPATKPLKRYVLFQDELNKWLEANRKNPVPLTPEELNAAILASHKRKPKEKNW